MSKGEPSDLDATRQQLIERSLPENGVNWLRHRLGSSAAEIDEMVLAGQYTRGDIVEHLRVLDAQRGPSVANPDGRVSDHLKHLGFEDSPHHAEPHRLPIVEDANGRLSFDISSVGSSRGSDWTTDEVAATVADYFEMLSDDLLGRPYNKAEHNRELQQRLNGRSRASIEFKHQNISAVLDLRGVPYIGGYKPRGNFQQLLADTIDTYLLEHPEELEILLGSSLPSEITTPSASRSFRDLLQDPPTAQEQPDKSSSRRRPSKIDFAARDTANRALGLAGEQFVVGIERQRLRESGRPDLGDQVCHVARVEGDGAGYDVRSFDEIGRPLHIEVKTTNLAKHAPFLVTANEVQFSIENPDSFCLYRVFAFRTEPALYILRGRLDERCALQPTAFRASPLPHKS